MEANLKKWLRPTIFAAAGAIAGLLYYTFFGCTSGCTIQSNPWLMAGYMAVIGLLVSGITKKEKGD